MNPHFSAKSVRSRPRWSSAFRPRVWIGVAVVASFAIGVPAVFGQEDHETRVRESEALFESSVGSILEKNCLQCHGGEKIRSGFDLATREGMVAGGDSGAVIDLENPLESRLLKLVRREEEPHMPAKGDPLSEDAINALERWIALGAIYDQPLIDVSARTSREFQVTERDRAFWSFRPLAAPADPVDGLDWGRGPIDAFVHEGLKRNELTPNPPATREAFIRRAYLDVIGLPPTPKQFEDALQMSKAELVDTLLSNPQYGERWARHWLDVARFAESHGFEQDYNRPYAYHYRDFVIKALNADMPFDQFVRWQIAGDEIAPEDPLALMATGFLGAGVFPTQLTEKEFESARYDELDDMVSTLGTAMLGLTVGCARCHDHKYDPIPMKDYYRMVSAFTTTIRSEIDVEIDPEGDRRRLRDWREEHSRLEQALSDFESQASVKNQFDDWLAGDALVALDSAEWVLPEPKAIETDGATRFETLEDGSILATGSAAAKEVYTVHADLDLDNVRWVRVEALTHDTLPQRGPGRASNGNFALSDFQVYAIVDGQRHELELTEPRVTHEQNDGHLSAQSAIDEDPSGTGWAVDGGGIGSDQAVVFRMEAPETLRGVNVWEFVLRFANNTEHSLGRFRLSVSSLESPPVAVGSGRSTELARAIEALEAGDLSSEDRDVLFDAYLAEDSDWLELNSKLQASLADRPEPTVTKVQVSSEGFPPTKHHADGRGFPHFYEKTYFLKRGDPNQKDEEASPGYLQVLMRDGATTSDWKTPAPEGWRTSYRRRSLANWMTDMDQGAGPLVARVIVNRLWSHHFGRGIVATPNDFGLQGSEPTHPELLETLASQLVEGGWRLKDLHRRILLSATYGQSSAPSMEKAAKDPENQWLWRFEPRRLEAEAIRDSLLSVSGELDPTMSGEGTLDPSHQRRSIYFFIKRSQLVPMMQIFDQPEPLVSQGRRPRTTVAPQALAFMNNPQIVEWARAFASEVWDLDSDVEKAVDRVYQRALSRAPSAAERRAATDFIEAQRRSYSGDHAESLALADFCQAVFAMNEFIYLQ